MAYRTRRTASRRPSRRTAYRAAAPRRTYRAPARRRTTRRRSNGSTGRAQTIRLVIDTGQHSGASLGPDGNMVKPASKPKLAKF